MGIPDVSPVLRISVGDGKADLFDWALFMLPTGNADGDFQSNDAYAFGSADKHRLRWHGDHQRRSPRDVHRHGLRNHGVHIYDLRNDRLHHNHDVPDGLLRR